MNLPPIIQGGMGVAISDWRLAKSVAVQGQLGVVSGTGIGIVLITRLQEGDPEGHMRRALGHFPFPAVAQRFLEKYFVPGGIPQNQPYKRPHLWSNTPDAELVETTVIAGFVEVWLAKEGHSNPVGMNLLEKVQLPAIATLYGAILADVDIIIIGAGIPLQIPGILDKLAENQPTHYRLDVLNSTHEHTIEFDPKTYFPEASGTLKRPLFFPIISSFVLAQALLKRSSGRIDGFVIETPIAGGHNAPPRQANFNDEGEPLYGDKDIIDYEKIKKLGLPFWIGGGYGNPQKLQEALALGAHGIQVGTAFAYCNESGMDKHHKHEVLQQVKNGGVKVRTDPLVSPTGFPFKVVRVPGTLADPGIMAERERVCDVGYLRHLYEEADGEIGYRCPAEPIKQYLRKGGKEEDTEGRVCLCNALGAAAGYPQRHRDGYIEPAIITSGDDLANLGQFLKPDADSYSAADVIRYLLGTDIPA
jgi:NAD(P)H-dependent flavin oxidoreductase YrpB (nitropropane dioxygenase family)